MSVDLKKTYSAKQVEEKCRILWESLFDNKPSTSNKKETFTIVMPPPNVTGVLHMGHALVTTLMDVMIRWKKMSGFNVHLQPGTDHAGIATQTIVEKHLLKKHGKKRSDFSREDFLNHVFEWKAEKEKTIISQIRHIGAFCDWSKNCFTLNDNYHDAVSKAFKILHDKKLIYRGLYLVNWDPITETAIADDEVEYEDRDGHLWHIKYQIKDSDDHLVIATTRPETLLADTAVAVHPSDERYKHLIGKKAIVPVCNREVNIIADKRVDYEFGTGALKVTPGHDHTDYEIGIEHDLEMISMLQTNGKINHIGEGLEGLSTQEARIEIEKTLVDSGFLIKKERHKHRVGVSYRSKATIEPMLSKQWFVKMSAFKTELKSYIASQSIQVVPSSYEKTFNYWIDNLRDWCVSRQLWWGHRIPVWYNITNPDDYVVGDGITTPHKVLAQPKQWKQDDDVLDTWFSSGLWPFASCGWPHDNNYLNHYPNSVLITGHDILFFWVARMMLMSHIIHDQKPFEKVFLHGLIFGKSYWRNKPNGYVEYVSKEEKDAFDMGKPLPKDVSSRWEKMSKSKGNVINPLEITEKYGTDSLRMTLCTCASQQRQIDLDPRKFESYKNFSNKIWNASRFVMMFLNDTKNTLTNEQIITDISQQDLTCDDQWIITQLNKTITKITSHLDNYRFDRAATLAYDFFWKDFCSYYLEMCKMYSRLDGTDATEKLCTKQKMLICVFSHAITLLHPFAPYITEEIFSYLKHWSIDTIRLPSFPLLKNTILMLNNRSCVEAMYPQLIQMDHSSEYGFELFEEVKDIVYEIRNIKGEMGLPPSERVGLEFVVVNDTDRQRFINTQLPSVKHMVGNPTVNTHAVTPDYVNQCGKAVYKNITILVRLPEQLLKKEITRLNKEADKCQEQIESISKALSNQSFVQRAPEHVVEEKKTRLSEFKTKLMSINEQIETLTST
jgi:valyl-tRNA synthetase